MNTEQETHILETPKIFSGLSKMASLCPELSHDRNASSQLKLSLDKVNFHSPYLFTKSSLFPEWIHWTRKYVVWNGDLETIKFHVSRAYLESHSTRRLRRTAEILQRAHILMLITD